MGNHAHRCDSFPLSLACSITSGSSPWCCRIPVSFVPRALSLAFEGTVPLSRPSGNVSRVLVACRLHSLAAAVPTACKHGRSGLCLWPLVTAQWWIHRDDDRPRARSGAISGGRQHRCSPTAARKPKPDFVILGSPPRMSQLPPTTATPSLQALGLF